MEHTEKKHIRASSDSYNTQSLEEEKKLHHDHSAGGSHLQLQANPRHESEENQVLRLQSYSQNVIMSTDNINEDLPDSDEEENQPELAVPLDPEIHQASVMHAGDTTLRILSRPRITWKWEGKPHVPFTTSRKLKIFCLTWNMFGKEPPRSLNETIPRNIHHDLYIISTQECLRSIGSSLIYSSKKVWESRIADHLGPDYYLFGASCLGATHLIIFIHYSATNLVTMPIIKTVTTGVGNVIANKGAIGICFKILNKEFLFIGCHLAAGHNSVANRNNDFRRIEREILRDFNIEKASEAVDACFYLGDMNYRINGSRDDVQTLADIELLEPLRKGDQLNIEMKENTDFLGFREGYIDFRPTYRFDCGTNIYDTSKKRRIPAWTDRIIYKCKNDFVVQKSYGSIMKPLGSDHKPVFSQFLLKFPEQKLEIQDLEVFPLLAAQFKPFITKNPKSSNSKTCRMF